MGEWGRPIFPKEIITGDGTGIVDPNNGYALIDFNSEYEGHTVQVSYEYENVFHPIFPNFNTRAIPLSGTVPVIQDGDLVYIADRGRYQVTHNIDSTAEQIKCTPAHGFPPILGEGKRIKIGDEIMLVTAVSENTDNTYTFTVTRGTDGTNSGVHDVRSFADLLDRNIELLPALSVSTNEIFLANPLANSYSPGAIVSSVLKFGDRQARFVKFHTQMSFNGTWYDADDYSGNPANDTYNFADYPMSVLNLGAITESFALEVTATNPVRVDIRGKRLGVIAQNVNISSDIAPANPNVPGTPPYFTLLTSGWGADWQQGNVLRFDTVGAEFEGWIARIINAKASKQQDDSAILGCFGDVATE